MDNGFYLLSLLPFACCRKPLLACVSGQVSAKSPTAATCSASVAVTGHFWNTRFLGSVLGEFISKQQLIWFPPFSVICLSYVKTAFVIYVSLMLTISGYLPVRGNQKRQCESFKLREQTTLAWRWSLLKYGCSSSPCLCSVCLEIHLFPVLLIICTNIAVSWDF